MTQRTYFRFLLCIIGLTAVFFSTFVSSQAQNPLDDIQQTAEQYVASKIHRPENGKLHIKAATLDSRLRLTHCPTALNASIPGKQSLTGNITVLISCETDNWQIYVPVRTQLMLPRVVATKPLARGVVLSGDDLTVQMIELRFQRGQLFEYPEKIIGSKMKRTVNMGEPVLASDICLVCRNDTVNIKAANNGLTIITKGIALADGSLGTQIRVQNSRSKRIIDASVTAVGEVTVNY